MFRKLTILAVLFLSLAALAQGDLLTAEQKAAIDTAAAKALEASGVPSASVAVVKSGRLAYVKAYGSAKLEPAMPAVPEMRYAVGSISKQFTATAILLLQQDGKLKLDDKVARFLPNLTRANEVTIRQLLTMTSGYQDYWPQDYVMPGMLKPVTAEQILDGWARKPLDFDPGTKYQYSNTNYVIAGEIVRKASGKDLVVFLKERVFGPLGMTTIADVNLGPLPASDAVGYRRFGLGPLRPAPKEGPGWLAAAGELAMTASDLARWDIAMIEQKVLKPESYREQQTVGVLKNGATAGYGLGIVIGGATTRRFLTHDGEVSGFTASNTVYPDDKAAVVVLTNQDAADAGGSISQAIAKILFTDSDAATVAATERAQKIFTELQQGKIDRSQFTENANFYFSDQALQDFQSSLGPLGAPKAFQVVGGKRERGGMTARRWSVTAGDKQLTVWTFEMPDRKLEQYQVAPE